MIRNRRKLIKCGIEHKSLSIQESGIEHNGVQPYKDKMQTIKPNVKEGIGKGDKV